jgi:catechol 2,3-dioxygenase-like lactoylglutathione lyase family enzyme
MAAIGIKRTNHTAFTVSDLDRAAAFFRDVLGFAITEKTRQRGEVVGRITGVPGAELDIAFAVAPGHMIELMQYIAPVSRRTFDLRPCDPGFSHIAFEVEDIDAAVAAIEAAGYGAVSVPQIVPAGPRKGGKNVYARGPDGIVIEFQEAPPAR